MMPKSTHEYAYVFYKIIDSLARSQFGSLNRILYSKTPMRDLSNQSQGNIRCKYNLLRKRNKKHRLVQWTIKYRNIHASFWLTILIHGQPFRLVFVSNIYQLHSRFVT
jgi:hypothetical protein